MSNVHCPYCGNKSEVVGGSAIYPGRRDLADNKYFVCYGSVKSPHELAYVGTHPDGEPLGSLADANLRRNRQKCHAKFDPLWKDGIIFKSRTDAYRWLVANMGLPAERCHIGYFRHSACNKLLSLLSNGI